jgi:proteasome lid subunit RPN8/RPN11
MTDFTSAFEEAKRHAREEFPKESCGLIVAGNYIRCENVAADPAQHREGDVNCGCQLCAFEISGKVYKQHLISGNLQMIVHSHPNGPLHPSKSDMETQEAMNLAWAIIPLDEERIGNPLVWGGATPIAPVVGREFVHGISDCYSVIRDCFLLGKDKLLEQGVTEWPFDPVELPVFPRDDAWWEGEADLYNSEPFKIGFIEVPREQARPGDVFLLKIRSDKFNHGGLLVGNNLILHHLPNRLSRREPAGIWGRQADRWLRYVGNADA